MTGDGLSTLVVYRTGRTGSLSFESLTLYRYDDRSLKAIWAGFTRAEEEESSYSFITTVKYSDVSDGSRRLTRDFIETVGEGDAFRDRSGREIFAWNAEQNVFELVGASGGAATLPPMPHPAGPALFPPR